MFGNFNLDPADGAEALARGDGAHLLPVPVLYFCCVCCSNLLPTIYLVCCFVFEFVVFVFGFAGVTAFLNAVQARADRAAAAAATDADGDVDAAGDDDDADVGDA